MAPKYKQRKPYSGRYPNTSLLAGDWVQKGACTPGMAGEQWDPSLHYDRARVPEAKLVCTSCDVAPQCLAYAYANGIAEGVWGGESFFSPSPGRPSSAPGPERGQVA